MSKSSITLKTDSLGGLSQLEPLSELNCSRSDFGKITKILRENSLPYRHIPKLIFIIYILGIILITIFFAAAISLAVERTQIAVILIIAMPILLVFLGALGGHNESRFQRSEMFMAKKVLKNTEGRITLEKGYVRRCGGEMKRGGGICMFKHRYYIIFATEKTDFKMKRGEVYRETDPDVVCLISPFKKSNFDMYRLEQMKNQSQSQALKRNQKYAEDRDIAIKSKGTQEKMKQHKRRSSGAIKGMRNSRFKEDDEPEIVYSHAKGKFNDPTGEGPQPSTLLSMEPRASNPYGANYGAKRDQHNDFEVIDREQGKDKGYLNTNEGLVVPKYGDLESNEEDGHRSPLKKHERKFSEGYIDGEDLWSKDPPYKL